MKQIRKSGITIVTLVITVIVLAILTGAVMLTMVGDNGIFGETQTTIDKYNKQATLEQIQLKIQKKRLAKVNEGQYSLKLEEDILPILETFGTYNENEMKLTTTEKNIDIYLYEIVNIPIKEIANVTYTNQELTISEKVQLPNGYTFEYTKDNGITWSEYTSTTTIAEENGILIRLKNEEGKIVSSEYKVTSGVIEEIDSTKPIISIDTNGVTTGKTIKVTIIVTDEKGLDRNNTYEYCISTSNNDTANVTWLPYTNGISFTVGEGLTGGYYIHVKGVTDTAGNTSENKVSEMLTFDNTIPAVTIDIGRITDTSIEVLAQSTDNSGQVKSTEYSIDNGTTWKTANTFTNLTANTSYTVKVKSVDIFNNENIQEKVVTTNPRTWNGKIDISWYTKDPNKTTFDISTPNELAGLALLVDNEIAYYDDPHDANNTSGTYSIAGSEFEGKTIVLNNNILINENVLNEDGTLNETNASTFVQWEPIGEPSTVVDPEDNTKTIAVENARAFKGALNGQNYNILGMYINKGRVWQQSLISKSSGDIHNIDVIDSYVYSEASNIGMIAGTNNGTIKNCNNYSSIFSVENSWSIGGIAGSCAEGSKIENCNNYGIIRGGKGIGGITGWQSADSTVKNCNNYEVLNGYYAVGGIVGESVGGITIECTNFSNIQSEGATTAGIAAYIGNNAVVMNSYNLGTISHNIAGSDGYSGGIVASQQNAHVLNCINIGQVSCKSPCIGGISGLIYGTEGSNIYNCYNSGNVSTTWAVGGILGYLIDYRAGSVYNCYNMGTISASSHCGGLIGDLSSSAGIIDNSYNIDTSYFGNLGSNATVGTVGTITGAGANASITVDGQTKTVIQALNEWVTANKATYPELKYWSWDNVNNRPIFVDSI